MKTQYYKLLGVGSDNHKEMRPSQFVFNDDDDNIVRGFVYKVEYGTCEIVLWEPTEIDGAIINLATELKPEVVQRMLGEILEKDLVARHIWTNLIMQGQENK